MADTFTPDERSEIMRRVKGRDTSPERRLRRAMWAIGLRGWRLAAAALPGKPDIVFRRARLAVFVDGCFWHGCPRHCRMPATNRAYWTTKIARNVERDRRQTRELRRADWSVVRLWEHTVRRSPESAARRVARALERRRKSLASSR